MQCCLNITSNCLAPITVTYCSLNLFALDAYMASVNPWQMIIIVSMLAIADIIEKCACVNWMIKIT